MRRRIHSLLLVLIALCLPLQAVAVDLLSTCRHSHQATTIDATPVASDYAGLACHEATMDVEAAAPAEYGCDNCESCQFASASVLPAGTDVVLPQMISVFAVRLAVITRSFIAAPPEQPPRH